MRILPRFWGFFEFLMKYTTDANIGIPNCPGYFHSTPYAQNSPHNTPMAVAII